MILYAESSAVLAWLLGEPGADVVRDRLASAELIIASDLTLVECHRVLIRAAALHELSEADAASRRDELTAVATHWTLLRISESVIEQARQTFPKEPIRTLDALHLASAVVARTAAAGVGVLSLDETVRANARALGFVVQPED